MDAAVTTLRPRTTARTLGEAFVAATELRKGRPFLIDAQMRLDGAQALRHSDKLASALHELGLIAGAKALFLSRPSVLHTLAWFSVIRLGAVATNLHLLEPPARMAETIAWLEASVVIFDEEFTPLSDALSQKLPHVRFVPLLGLMQAGASESVPLDAGHPNDPVAIVLSSGSTGPPKGVVHTHASVLASVAAAPEVYRGMDANDSILVCIGTSFGGWCNVVPPFLGHGARLVFQRRFDPQAFLQELADERISVAAIVPTMWRMVLAAEPDRYDLSNLRLAFMSGEMASRSDVEQIRSRITPLVRAAYLSTEGACGCGIVADEDQFLTDARPAGRPLTGAAARIVAPNDCIDDILSKGEVGEILLSGASLASGYWKDHERTAERFRGGWWRSGDTGYQTEDDRIVIVGRTDHVINSGGVKFQAEDIEAALMSHPDIVQAAVIGVPDHKWGQRAEAFVVARKDGLDAEAVVTWCQADDQGPAARLLKVVHVVDRLPTGPTGKLYRPALHEHEKDR